MYCRSHRESLPVGSHGTGVKSCLRRAHMTQLASANTPRLVTHHFHAASRSSELLAWRRLPSSPDLQMNYVLT